MSQTMNFQMLSPLRKRAGLALLCLLAIWSLTVWAWLALLIPKAEDVSFPEGALVGSAYEVALGNCPYQDWRQWPHHFSPYGPLTYYPVGWATGAIYSPCHPMDIYRAGRIQSFTFLIGIAVLLAILARRLGLPWGAALAAPCLLTAWRDPTLLFVVSYRPDAPAIFFSLLAIVSVLPNPVSRWRYLVAFLSLSVSMWFKSTGWTVPLVLAGMIWRCAGWKRAAILLGLFIGLNLAAVIALDRCWNGMLLLNMIGSLDNGVDWKNIPLGFKDSFPWIPKIIYFFGLGIATYNLFRRRGTENNSTAFSPGNIVQAAALNSFAVALIQTIKVGSGMNYYLESYALACVVAAEWGYRAFGQADPAGDQLRRAFAIGGIFIFLTAGGIGEIAWTIRDYPNQLAAWKTSALTQGMESFDGETLSTFPFHVLRRPSPPTILDYVQYGILARRGKIDQDILLRKIERREFKLVLVLTENVEFNNGWFPPDFMPTLLKYYQVTGRVDLMTIFEPIP
ncbi:hypothetical protein HYR69_04215 [Candidatus Sumerlaeota bacterium]|nr:hypothetical protein [Candidatus Sumerlaeota bacterium]